MNDRLQQIANDAALHANLNCGTDRDRGHYWLSLYTEKYTELIVEDLGKLFKGDVPSRLSYELVKRAYSPGFQPLNTPSKE